MDRGGHYTRARDGAQAGPSALEDRHHAHPAGGADADQAAAPLPDQAASTDVIAISFPEQAFAEPADVRVHTSTDPTLLAGIDRFLETVPRRFIRDSHAIRITTGRSAPQQAATVELAVPAALTARSASQDEYLVWARYPQAGDAVPPHTYLTADVRYIQARDLLRFDLEPAAFTLRPDGQWEAVLVLSTPDVQPEPEADAPAETATANASR